MASTVWDLLQTALTNSFNAMNSKVAHLIEGEDETNHVMKSAPVAYGAGGAAQRNHVLSATLWQAASGGGTLYALHIENAQAATAFIQVFDKLSANVTLATTVPDWEFQVPASSDKEIVIGAPGALLANGLTIASTTTSHGSTTSAATVYGTVILSAPA